MKNQVKLEGKYELFETTNGNPILNLDHNLFFAVVKAQRGEILVKTDADHQKRKSLHDGKYYLINFSDDPDFNDVPHLFMENNDHYKEWILPQGLPLNSKDQKKLIKTEEKIDEEKVKLHAQNKRKHKKQPDKKQARPENGNLNHLLEKTKKDLYKMAQKQDLNGRSKMNKKELASAIAHK